MTMQTLKPKALKGISGAVVILGLVSLFTDIASEMLYPVTPIFLNTLGTPMALIGLIEGLAELTSGVLKGYFGALSDKTGKRSVFVFAGYGLSALVKPLPGLIQSFPAVLFARITDRIGKGIRTAPRDALLAGYSDGNTGAVFGFHRAMDTLGAAIGPVVSLCLLAAFPGKYPLIFILAFIPSVAAVAFTLVVKDNKPALARVRSKRHYSEFWQSAPSAYKYLVVLLTLFAFINSSDVFLILKSRSAFKSDSLAIIGYIFYNLVYAAAAYPLGLLSDRLGKRKVFIAGLVIFSSVYLGFALSGNVAIIWILFALYGIYAAATEGITKAWVSDMIKDDFRGTAIGLLTMLSSLAMMAGSAFTGILWDLSGPALPFLITSGVSLLIALLIIFTRKM
ncbi:MAG: MFS transporter [Bacillota bacterium]